MRPVQLSALVMYCCTFIFGTLCTVAPLCARTTPADELIRIGKSGDVWDRDCGDYQAPYFFAEFDAAGYCDVVYFARSPSHPYDCHEILSGEWASAIYYDGIATGNKSMWLTDKFIYPNWDTNSNFLAQPNMTSSEENLDNPTPGIDTASTTITNRDIEITIDYEVVDLAFGDPGTHSTWSSMAFRLQGIDNAFFAKSQRYIILQTYTIKNLKTEALEGLEFYQMLHAHPGGEFDSAAISVYEDRLPMIDDPLASYVPYDPNHSLPGSNTVGNFRYDITQWNDLSYANSSTDHVDWVNFSTNREPDMIDQGTFTGYLPGKPASGPHVNIENRQLNGIDEAYDTEAAGAMGWFLQDLAPDQSTSITFAFMFGYRENFQSSLDLNCSSWVINPCDENKVNPTDPNHDEVNYIIDYGNPITDPGDENYVGPIVDAYIINSLPREVDFVSAFPEGYIYDPQQHSCTWQLDPINPGDYDYLIVNVKVTERAAPAGQIVNNAILEVDGDFILDTETVGVCCWQDSANTSGTIYVDAFATGNNTGVSWANAYRDLHAAFTQIDNGCSSGNEIWVAAGHYSPPNDANQLSASFPLSDGLEVYGGFPNGGGTWQQRDYLNNLTWLTADISGGAQCQNVVHAKDISTVATIDGFVILNAFGFGVVAENAALNINNCVITGNGAGGIMSDASDTQITGSIISNNGGIGISFTNNPASTQQTTAAVTNNQISSNSDYGVSIMSDYTSIFIANNLINSNGTLFSGGGVYVSDPNDPVAADALMLQNNTIIYNENIGIETANAADPDIVNCIIWGHPVDVADCNNISYSCFAEAVGTNGNINIAPGFTSNDPNDYHLASDSPCIDAGDPNKLYTAQFDLDGDDRVIDVVGLGLGINDIDIGADEYACDDVQNPMDFNNNHIVAMDDLIPIAERWLADTAVVDPNHVYDVVPEGGDNIIDILELNELMSQWMWQPCWQDDSSTLWIHHRRLYMDIIRQKP